MSLANPLWGAPRIHGELIKLGIDLSQATVAKYMVRHPKPPSQNWRTFLENHVKQLVSIDFFTVPTIRFQILYVFLVLAHDRRRIVHFNATAHPTAERTGQQLRQAFPFDQLPRYLLRDRDAIFGADFRTQVTSVWRNCGIRTRLLYYRRFKWFLRGSYEGSINAYKLKLGSQQFLKNRQDTLRVFLYAPPEDKVRRLLARGK